MTTIECLSRDQRTLDRIQSMFRTHAKLGPFADSLQVNIENASIVVRGELPSTELKLEVVPIIRQAGVLSQIANFVELSAAPS